MRETRETDEVLVCMAQRLQGQLERQLTLVERLQAGGRDESLLDLAELRTSLQRALRGSENLLVLGGAQQGPRARGPRSVADVLADARAGIEDVTRVGLGPAPDATIAPRAVAGLLALFTELFTHAATVAAPLTRVDVVSARSEDGGVVVEVVVDGPGPVSADLDELNRRLADRPVIDDIVSNRVGLFVAARLARRCGATVRVQHRRDSLAGGGLLVVVHCPPDLLDAVAFSTPAASRPWTREPAAPDGNGNHGPNGNGGPATGSGNGGLGSGFGGPRAAPERTRRPDPLSDPLPGFAVRRDPEPVRRPEPPRARSTPEHPHDAPSAEHPRRLERTRHTEPPRHTDPAPRADPGRRSEPAPRAEPLWRDEPRRPEDPFRPGGPVRPVQPPLRSATGSMWDDEPPLRRGSGDAELFGPLTSSLRDRMRESGPTPIYEAVASAWFVDGDGDGGAAATARPAGAPPTDWNTPSDAEWRAASERATRPAGPPQPSTAAGLPRRRPGTQMVAPPRHGTPAPPNGSREREPERVRERLAVYQQGLERGRHRAAENDA